MWGVLFIIMLLCSGCSGISITTCNGKPQNDGSETQQEEITSESEISNYDVAISSVCPIISGTGCVVGGVKDGEWLEVGNELQELIKGEEKYNIYSLTGKIEEATGSTAVWRPGAVEWLQVEFTPKYELTEQNVAMSASWPAMPRVPVMQKDNIEGYEQEVKRILEKNGIMDSQVKVNQVIRIDLEGDGTEEVIVNASSLEGAAPIKAPKGSYSMIFLRKLIAGKVKTMMLREEYYTDYLEAPVINKVASVLDANGDGVMEIMIWEGYYEGKAMYVYEIKEDMAKIVLGFAIGA